MTTDKNSGNAIINLYAVSPIVTIESISSASNTLGIFNHNDAFKPTFIDSSADAVDKSSSHPMSIVKGTDDQYSQHLQNSTFPVNLLYDTELHQSTLQSSMNHFSLNSNNISNINDTTIFGIDTSSVHGGRNSMDNSNFPQDPLNPAMFLNGNTVLNTSSILKDPGNVGGNNRKSPVVTSQAELLNDLLGANDTKNTRDEYYPGQRSVSPSYFRAPSLLGNNSLNALGRKSIPGTFTVGGAQQFSHHDPSGVIPNLHAFGANLNNSSMISGVTNRSIGSTSVKQQLKIVRRSSTSIHIPYSDSIKATFSGSFEQLVSLSDIKNS